MQKGQISKAIKTAAFLEKYDESAILPKDIALLVSNLIDSVEIAEFQNLHHLNVNKNSLPILPSGYFWYKNHESWTIRKERSAPEIVLDLDLYLRNKHFVGYNVSVNKNLLDTAVVAVHKESTNKASRGCGGYELEDFENLHNNFGCIIGHGIAHADTVEGFTKANTPIKSDQNPRNFSPEQSTRKNKGNKNYSDIGETIRNHELEQKTRSQKGTYREFNEFSNNSHQVYCGLLIPDIKHMIRIMPQNRSYAQFIQGNDYELKKIAGKKQKAEDLWNKNKKSLQLMPKTRVLDLNSTTMPIKKLNFGFGYILNNQNVLTFREKQKLKIGDQYLVKSNNEIRVIVECKDLGDTFVYSYYEFRKFVHMPRAVLCKSALIKFFTKELDESDNSYKQRFSPIDEALVSLEKVLVSLENYENKYRERVERVYNAGGLFKKNIHAEAKKIRKNDISELANKTKKQLKLASICLNDAKMQLLEHNYNRNVYLASVAVSQASVYKEELYSELGRICFELQKADKEVIVKIIKLIDKVSYHLRSAQALMSPPQLESPTNAIT